MKTRNRVISLLLTACMMLSLCAALPMLASAEVVSTSGWDGMTATKPEGTGTKDDPYLIASAENLLWLQKQIPAADAVGDTHADVVAGKYTAKFAGEYFLQTQDIDLNGKNFASIGYYYSNANRMGAFGGTYDGQGFAIRNGKIVSKNAGYHLNRNWGHGLFGMIYGATIKNIVLDNVQVEGHGIVGAIVGRAVLDVDNTSKAETFNTVENCIVNANCTITAKYPNDSVSNVNRYGQTSRAGGIVGMAYGTTIRYCVNNAKIVTPANWNATGGIAGSVGNYAKVEYCVNNGMIENGTSGTGNKAENSVGGIVGSIMPYGVKDSYREDDEQGCDDPAFQGKEGGAVIQNCVNNGTLKFVGTKSSAIHFGGILGGINQLAKLTDEKAYLINHCYNTFAFTFKDHTSMGTKTDNFRIAGILGSAWCNANADVNSLWIGNSSSVDVEENHYSGTNEYRDRKNLLKSGETYVREVMDGEVSTVTTKTADEIAPLTKAITDAIAAFNKTATAKKVGQVAYQFSTGTTNSVRFSAQIVGNDYERVGFKVYASYTEDGTVKTSKVNDVPLYTYYTSLKAGEDDVAPDAGNNFIAFVIDSIPTDKGDVTFTFQPYVVTTNGTSYGNTISVTFAADGTVK